MNRFSKTLVAGAVAALAAGPAAAAIDGFTNGNGELFFNVYSPNAPTPTSFVFDLTPVAGAPALGSFLMDSFLPAGVPAGASGSAPPGTADGFPELRWTVSSSTPGWSTFIANAGGSLTDWRWNVVAGDSTGSQGVANQVRYLTTSPQTAGLLDNTTSGQINNWKLTQSFVNSVNAATTDADASAAFTAASGGEAYFGAGFGPAWRSNMASGVTSVGALDAVLPFYYITGSGGGTAVTQFVGTWTFGANATGGYDLVYSAIPEPTEWALMVAGLMAAGFMARRRRAR